MQFLVKAVDLVGPVAAVLGDYILRCVEMQHRGGKLLPVGDFGPGLEDIFRAESLVMEDHFVAVHRIGQGDDRLGGTLMAYGLVFLVFEQRRGISVGAVDVERRLEIILHAVGQVSLCTQGKGFVIGRSVEALAEIGLIKSVVVADGKDYRVVIGLHHNLFSGGIHRHCDTGGHGGK